MTVWTEDMIREGLDALQFGVKKKPPEPEPVIVVVPPALVTAFKTDRMRHLIECVAKLTDTKQSAIKGRSRRYRTTRARHIVYYIARHAFHYSLPEIARLMGKADHTTIMHGVRKVEGNPEYFEPELSVAWNAFTQKSRAA